MIRLDSLIAFFSEYGTLRKSPRKTLAALVWAVLSRQLLGLSKIGHSLAMAKKGKKAKHVIKQVDRCLGNLRINMRIAQRDLIHYVLGDTREALITWDWTDPQDGIHQILSLNWRAHGRAIPLAWVTVRKDPRKDPRRTIEIGLLKRVAGEWPRSCHPILLADRGFGTIELFPVLNAWGWDGIIRGKATTHVEVRPGVWLPLAAWAAKKPVLRDLAPVRYGKSSGDQAYRCRIVIWAEVGYQDPWFLLVSRGLRKSRWPARLITAATGQPRGSETRRGRSPRSRHPFDAKNSGPTVVDPS